MNEEQHKALLADMSLSQNAIEHLRKFVQFLNHEGETMLEFGKVLPEYKAWLAGERRKVFTVVLYDEDGRCKVDNQFAYTHGEAEKKSLAGYAELYPARTWRGAK